MPKNGWPKAVQELVRVGPRFPNGTRKTIGAIVARTVGTPKKGR